MPIIKAIATFANCDFCPAVTSHIAGSASVLPALEHFEAQHWALLDDSKTLACPKCAPILTTITDYTAKGLELLEATHAPTPKAAQHA
jgi:hypothetical protein